MLQHCTCKTFGHVSSTWPVSLVFLESVKFAANASVIVLCMLWDHQVHPERLGFIHYAQSHVIGMQRNQTLREFHWDVCNPCCVHAHSRLKHSGFSRCWGYKQGYWFSPGAEQAFSAKGGKVLCWFAWETLQTYTLLSCFSFLHCVKQINIMFSNRAGTGARCSELKSWMSTHYGTMEVKRKEKKKKKDEWFLYSDRWLQFATLRSPQRKAEQWQHCAPMAGGDCSQSSSQQWCLCDSMVSLCSENHFEIAA